MANHPGRKGRWADVTSSPSIRVRTPSPALPCLAETGYVNHPNVARDLNNLAILLQSTGDNAAAESLYRRALAIDETILGPEHPTTKAIRANLLILLSQPNAKKMRIAGHPACALRVLGNGRNVLADPAIFICSLPIARMTLWRYRRTRLGFSDQMTFLSAPATL